MHAWLVDILSAAGLPLLYSLAVTSLSWPWVGGVLCVGLLLSWGMGLQQRRLRPPCYIDYCLDLASVCVKLTLNLSTLLAQAGQSDADLGAVLCIAPVFTLICIPGTLCVSYAPIMQNVAALTGGLVVFVSVCMMFLQGEGGVVPPPTTLLLQSVIQIFFGALCSNEGHEVQLNQAGRRTLVYIILASSRMFISSLLRGSPNILVWLLHGVLLCQSCLLLARALREHVGRLDVKDPCRCSILINCLLVTAAYAWRSTVDSWGAWSGLLLVMLSVLKSLTTYQLFWYNHCWVFKPS